MKKLLLIFSLIFMVTSCDDNMSYMDEMTDLQLIEAIQADPNKFEIDEVDIPNSSKLVIGSEYFDYMMVKAEISPDYGYQLSLGDMALDAGDITQIYFTKDGRKLGNKSGMDDRKRHAKRCFKFAFPLSFTLGDQEAIYTVNDYTEFRDRLKTNYQETGVKMKPDFTYPIQVEFKPEEEGGEGEVLSINSEEELKEAFQACRGEQNDKKCFSIAFPVSFTMPDESIITASDEEDLSAQMKAFFESYEGKKTRPKLVFPVDITFEDGSILTVNSREEMKQAWKDNCRRKGGEEDEGESGSTRG